MKALNMTRVTRSWITKGSVVAIAAGLLMLTGCGDDSDSSPPQVSNEAVTMTLLHSNDTHSQLESFTPFGEPEQGGVARRKAVIEDVRDEVGEDQVLLVDAGDFSQGTTFYNAWKGSASVMALNAMGYDVGTLGNHEFDLGPVELGRALRGEPVAIAGDTYLPEPLDMPLVNTNLDLSSEPALADLIEGSVVLTKGGGKIGVLGVITETVTNISNTGNNISVSNYLTSTQQEVDRLKAQGLNKIVLLSHAGFAVDRQMATQLDGVDIIVSGHDHSLLLPPSFVTPGAPTEFLAEKVKGDYPTVATAANGDPLLLVSAFEWGKILGRLDVTFDGNGVLTDWNGAPILIDDAVTPEPQLASDVAFFKAPISAFTEVLIGEAQVFFDGNRIPGVRDREMPLGNLVADTMLAAASTFDTAVAAITNGGGIRASLPQDVDPQVTAPPFDVTFGQALTVLPFGNTIVAVDVTGMELVAALDNGLTWAYDPTTGETRSSGAFPQVAGMIVSYCGQKVSDIRNTSVPISDCPDALRNGGVVTELQVNGMPVEMDTSYRVATNNFLAGGGDFYQPLANACERGGETCIDTGVLMLDAFVDEFNNNSPVSRTTEGRLITQ